MTESFATACVRRTLEAAAVLCGGVEVGNVACSGTGIVTGEHEDLPATESILMV